MREDGRPLGSPANMSDLRHYPMLRQFAEPSCQQACAPERASRDCVGAAVASAGYTAILTTPLRNIERSKRVIVDLRDSSREFFTSIER